MTAPLGRRRVEVVGYERVGAYDVLACADETTPRAGQFYMLAAAERWGGGDGERPFLPRAFSVLSVRDGRLEFMLENVGPGTERLGELRPGDGLWLAGPFGNGFEPPREGREPLLVGGGVGIAPLAILAESLGAPLVLLGFRDGPHAAGASLIPGARVATDDGSVGHAGPVTDLLLAELGRPASRTVDGADRAAEGALVAASLDRVEVYACGPPGMLEAIRGICEARGVPAQLALESGMACGYGACFGCVVPTRQGYVRLCVDGPVLRADELEAVVAH